MNSREGLSYKHVQTEKLMNTIPPFKSRLFLVSLTLQSVCGLLFQFSTLAQKQERLPLSYTATIKTAVLEADALRAAMDSIPSC